MIITFLRIHVFIQELIENWKSILYHIIGVHSWFEEGKPKKCGHNDLSLEQQRRKKMAWKRLTCLPHTAESCSGQRTSKGFEAKGSFQTHW